MDDAARFHASSCSPPNGQTVIPSPVPRFLREWGRGICFYFPLPRYAIYVIALARFTAACHSRNA